MSQFSFDAENNHHRSFELPGAKPHYNPDRPGQVEHIYLDLSLDIPNQSYQGSCRIRLLPISNGVDRLILDAVNLNIKSVEVNEVSSKFDCDGEQLFIQLSQPTQVGVKLLLAIAYSVEKPQRGIYFIQPDKHYPANLPKSGLKEKMKTHASGFPASTIQDNYLRVKSKSEYPNNL